MIFDHLKPRPVQRDKNYFSKSKRSLKGRHYLCNAQKSGQRDSSNSWERNGRKCRHVYVVINPDLQAQDQPKGKQQNQKNRKYKMKIHSVRDRFFLSSSPCVTIIAIRIAHQQQQMRQTNKFFFRVFPTRTLFISPTCHKTRRDDDVCPPLNRRETHRDDRHISLNTSRFCLFVFVSSSSSFEK